MSRLRRFADWVLATVQDGANAAIAPTFTVAINQMIELAKHIAGLG